MEVAARKQQLLLLPSMAHDPNSPSSSTSSSSPSSAAAAASSSPSSHRPPPPPPSSSSQPALPPSPRTVVPRTIDTTPFPTTFVQADTASFKQVVQMLTGSDTTPPSQRPPAKSNHHQHHHSGAPCRPKKQAFKLYERRSGVHKNFKMIAPLAMAAAAAAGASSSPRKAAQHQQQEALSPSVLDFPSLALSPVTPLVADPFNRSPASASTEEEAATITLAQRREEKRRGVREREEEGRVMMWQPDTWDPRGAHADSPTTSDKTRSKTTRVSQANGFVS